MNRLIICIAAALCLIGTHAQAQFTTQGTQLMDATGHPFVIAGNNRENAWLDLVDSRDWKTPTQWGREAIEGECGIRQTAQPACVFEEDITKE